MYRATTPTLSYTFNGASPDDFADILITISQNGQCLINKHKDDCTIKEGMVSIELTQEETALLEEGVACTQIRAITPGGKVHASGMIEFNAEDVLNDEILEVPDE